MDGYRLDLSSPPDWRPLERLQSLLLGRPNLPDLASMDFVHAGVLRQDDRAIHLYKHVHTRAYLCLDVCGHAFLVHSERGDVTAAIAPVIDEVLRVIPENAPCRDS